MVPDESLALLFREAAGRLLVGYSGGMDSTVLLHMVAERQRRHNGKAEIHALHINHGISERAGQWEDHCRRICQDLEVPFTALTVSVEAGKGGLEERAREVRYRAFQGYLVQGDCLLLAHHLDDQAETILFNLLRGAGQRGSRGMPERRPLGEGTLVRPLLEFSRHELREYAHRFKLAWIEDESNQDLSHSRNYLRHRVIPSIRDRWPDFAHGWSRSARIASEAYQLNTELADLDLARVCGSDSQKLDRLELAKLTAARQRNLFARWIDLAGLPQPGRAQMTELLRQSGDAGQDSRSLIEWAGGQVRGYREHLYVMMPLGEIEPLPSLPLIEGQPTPVGGGRLIVRRKVGAGVRLHHGLEGVIVRYRCGGERCRPVGRSGSHPLKKIFQELGVPAWLRSRIPLIYVDEELIAVAGLFACHGHGVDKDETGWEFEWSCGNLPAPGAAIN